MRPSIASGSRPGSWAGSYPGSWSNAYGDPDATAYIHAVTTAGGTVGGTAHNAINEFIVGEKAAGRWDLLKCMFMPSWGVAAANRIDMVTLDAGTFVPTVTHAAGYVQMVTSGYFNLGAIPSAKGLTASDFHFWNATITAPSAGNRLAFGVIQGSNYMIHGSYTSGTPGYRISPFAGAREVYVALDLAERRGIMFSSYAGGDDYTINRRAAGNSYLQEATQAASGSVPTLAPFAMSLNNGGAPLTYNDSRFIGFGFGLGMSKADGAAFISAFQTMWETCTGLTLP